MGSVAKQFLSLTKTIGMQRRNTACLPFHWYPTVRSSFGCLQSDLALHFHGHANTCPRWPSSWKYWGV